MNNNAKYFHYGPIGSGVSIVVALLAKNLDESSTLILTDIDKYSKSVLADFSKKHFSNLPLMKKNFRLGYENATILEYTKRTEEEIFDALNKHAFIIIDSLEYFAFHRAICDKIYDISPNKSIYVISNSSAYIPERMESSKDNRMDWLQNAAETEGILLPIQVSALLQYNPNISKQKGLILSEAEFEKLFAIAKKGKK